MRISSQRVKIALFALISYWAIPNANADAKEPEESIDFRPKLNLVTKVSINESQDESDEFKARVLLSFLNLASIENRLPVPTVLKYPWQNTFVLAIPPLAKMDFKKILCDEMNLDLNGICDEVVLQESGRRSEELNALGYIDYPNNPNELDTEKPIKVIVIAGTHGNEPSSVKVAMNWLSTIVEQATSNIQWRFIPTLNPDGLLATPRMRTNARGVDLNRNMPTLDWQSDAFKSWITRSGSQKRFYPGKFAASEAETRFLVEQIESFNPDIIVSVHAPYNLVDFDHSSILYAPPNIGVLNLRQLGSFPGSLGRYTGFEREIPTVTIELKDAVKTPSETEYKEMFTDLVYWINNTNQGLPVSVMPSTNTRRILAQKLKEQKLKEQRELARKKEIVEQQIKASEQQAQQYEAHERTLEEILAPIPVITQPYIIQEKKKIDVVPVIL